MKRFRITWDYGYHVPDGTSEEHDVTWFSEEQGFSAGARETMCTLDVGDSFEICGVLDKVTIQRAEDGQSDQQRLVDAANRLLEKLHAEYPEKLPLYCRVAAEELDDAITALGVASPLKDRQ